MSKILAYIDYVAMANTISLLKRYIRELDFNEVDKQILKLIKLLDEGIDKDVRKYITNNDQNIG